MGPFNSAFIARPPLPPEVNVNYYELSLHCATGRNAATGGIGAPYDFAAVSLYIPQNQPGKNGEDRIGNISNALSIRDYYWTKIVTDSPLLLKATKEVHEMGVLGTETNASVQVVSEPGVRGAVQRLQLAIGLRKLGVKSISHWDISENLGRPNNDDLMLLKGEAWTYFVFDHMWNSSAWSIPVHGDTSDRADYAAMAMARPDEVMILVCSYNKSRNRTDPHDVEVLLPAGLAGKIGAQTVLASKLARATSVFEVVRDDLDKIGLLKPAFHAEKNEVSLVRNMTDAKGLEYVVDNGKRYEDVMADSRTLKSLPNVKVLETDGGFVVKVSEMETPSIYAILLR